MGSLLAGRGGDGITGNTSAASCRWPPRTLFQNILREAAKILDAAGIATVVLIAPIAWYLTGKCCDNLDHIVNLGTDEFHGEMLRASNAAEEAVIVAQLDENFHVFHPMDIWGGTDPDHSEAVTSDGRNPVYRTSRPTPTTILPEPTPAAKQTRLESVVPMGGSSTGFDPRLGGWHGSPAADEGNMTPPLPYGGSATARSGKELLIELSVQIDAV